MAGAPLSSRAALELALELQRKGRLADAAAIYEGVLALDARDFNALHMLGVVRMRQRRFDVAEALLRAALAVAPPAAAVHSNLGNLLRDSGRATEAIACYDEALRLESASESAVRLNRALAHLALRDAPRARADLERARALEPGDAEIERADAHLRLALGDLEAGWAAYEARLRLPEASHLAPPEGIAPWSKGEPLDGRTVLVRCEQGIGDALQFARFVPRLQARGARVILAAPDSLRALLEESLPGVAVVGADASPAAERYAPLMSLPHRLGARDGDPRAAVPYLRAPAARRARWRERLAGPRGPRIGLAWAGNPLHRDDHRRSMPADCAAALVVDGARWFSLQVGATVPLPAAGTVDSLGPSFGDFADTAAAIEELDLVVTVDTAVAHLAGALGKPAWVLLPWAAEWRWMLDREDSPWYPTLRLFRQPRPGDWPALVDAVRAELRAALG